MWPRQTEKWVEEQVEPTLRVGSTASCFASVKLRREARLNLPLELRGSAPAASRRPSPLSSARRYAYNPKIILMKSKGKKVVTWVTCVVAVLIGPYLLLFYVLPYSLYGPEDSHSLRQAPIISQALDLLLLVSDWIMLLTTPLNKIPFIGGILFWFCWGIYFLGLCLILVLIINLIRKGLAIITSRSS